MNSINEHVVHNFKSIFGIIIYFGFSSTVGKLKLNFHSRPPMTTTYTLLVPLVFQCENAKFALRYCQCNYARGMNVTMVSSPLFAIYLHEITNVW